MMVMAVVLLGAVPAATSLAAPPLLREIVRSRHHYKDWYSATFDGARARFATRAEIEVVAQQMATRAGVELVGGGFVHYPQGFRVAGSEQAALALLEDQRIRSVEEEGEFSRAMEPIAGSYVVELDRGVFGTDWPRPADVQAVAEELVSRYGGKVEASYVPGGGFVATDMPEEGARALSKDQRVLRVSEDAALKIDSEAPPWAEGQPHPFHTHDAPERLHRDRSHYKDWYFVVLDGERVDVRSRESIRAVATETGSVPGVQVLPGEFLDAPQGFRVAGPAAAVSRLLGDSRVKWLQEIGSFQREPEPVPGTYIVEFTPEAPGGPKPSEEKVLQLARTLLADYGGHLLSIRAAALIGFSADQMSDASARAMSQDPRVASVGQDGVIRLDLGLQVSTLQARLQPALLEGVAESLRSIVRLAAANSLAFDLS
jgi:hypothetical protein